MAGLRLGTTIMSTIGESRLVVLIYHRVLPAHDDLRADECDAGQFDWQMRLLADNFTVLPVSEAISRLRRRDLPPRAACITFDDGYADNATVALPILRRYDLPATFFVATGFLNGGRMWNDSVIEAIRQVPGERLDLTDIGLSIYPIDTIESRRKAISDVLTGIKHRAAPERTAATEYIIAQAGTDLPTDLMMTSGQLLSLVDAGMEVGGHTVSHPILAALSPDEARREIADGKRELEEITRRPVTLFAYPNGNPLQDYDSMHVAMVRENGFAAAVTTSWGVATPDVDRYQIPRFTPWDRSPRLFLARLLHNYTRTSPQLCSALPRASATDG